MHCDVEDGNPGKLLKVQWMMNGDILTELPECNGKEEVSRTPLFLNIVVRFIYYNKTCVCVSE
jgi:hypothetical protein